MPGTTLGSFRRQLIRGCCGLRVRFPIRLVILFVIPTRRQSRGAISVGAVAVRAVTVCAVSFSVAAVCALAVYAIAIRAAMLTVPAVWGHRRMGVGDGSQLEIWRWGKFGNHLGIMNAIRKIIAGPCGVEMSHAFGNSR